MLEEALFWGSLHDESSYAKSSFVEAKLGYLSKALSTGIVNCETLAKSRWQVYIIRVTGAVIPLALTLCILFNFGTAFGRQLQDD